MTVSPEKLAEMLAAATNPGVTEGPWRYLDIGEVWHAVEADDNHTPVAVTDHGDPTGEHIANCDPATIATLVTELQHRREAEAGTWTRDHLAEALATIDGVHLDGNAADVSHGAMDWEEYRRKADDVLALLSLAASPSSPARP